ncbi:MAG TPA: hypothetical protein PK846_10205, partial [Spirochaetota bacterium]|nr:hypothetical protein [Spirochaetota bacterium]
MEQYRSGGDLPDRYDIQDFLQIIIVQVECFFNDVLKLFFHCPVAPPGSFALLMAARLFMDTTIGKRLQVNLRLPSVVEAWLPPFDSAQGLRGEA